MSHQPLPSVLRQRLTFSKPGSEREDKAARSAGLGQAVVLGRSLNPRHLGLLALGPARELAVWAADQKWQVSGWL